MTFPNMQFLPWQKSAFGRPLGACPSTITSSQLQSKPGLTQLWRFNPRNSLSTCRARQCASDEEQNASSRGPWVATQQTWRSAHRNRAPTGRRGLRCQAIALPETLDATFRNIISISAVVGISYAVLLAAVSEPKAPEQQPGQQPGRALPPPLTPARAAGLRSSSGDSGNDDNFVWGLMGFISILPLFNWLAWVLAAISNENRATLYGIYAVLYGSPLLLRGLDWQDPWMLFMVALCAVHVQAERIAQTEPEALRSIQPVGAVGAALRGVVLGTGSVLSGLGAVLAEDSRRVVRRPGGRSSSVEGNSLTAEQLGTGEDRLQLEQDPDLASSGSVPGRVVDPRRDPDRVPDMEDFATQELRQFDEQLMQAGKRRRGGRAGGSGNGSGGAGGGAGK